MACGTPIVTSNTSSMPEIAGKDAVLVNPESSDEIAEMMLRLETDETFKKEHIDKGLRRVALFSWRNTAKHLLKLYEEVYNETNTKNY